MTTISLINMKGGVAKTTLAVNIADFLCRRHNKHVLIIDIDPQFNATQCLISGKSYIKHMQNKKDTIINLFDRQTRNTVSIVSGSGKSYIKKLDEVLPITIKKNLSLLPGSLELFRIEMASGEGREHRLKKYLEKSNEKYDYVIIDTPPTPSVWMTSALLASEYYLIPVKPDPISLTGIDLLRSIVNEKVENFGLSIKCIGLVLTIVEKGTIVHRSATENLSKNRFWKNKLFTAFLPKRTLVARQQANQKFILDGNDSVLSSSLSGIVNELIARLEND